MTAVAGHHATPGADCLTPLRPAGAEVHPARIEGPRLDIDLDAVAANVRRLAATSRGALMAVVKADGFGHGAAAVARTALAHGATWLGVTSVAEALALRAGGIAAPILSWLNPVAADYDAALTGAVDLAAPGVEHLVAIGAAAARTGRSARVHLHLDTGMARDGCEPARWTSLFATARREERSGRIRVVGLMGHLPCADAPGHAADRMGRERFEHGIRAARAAGLHPGTRHLAATAATLTEPRTHYDLVRVGAGLVGIDPSGTTALHPALTLTAPVVTLRTVPAGTGVGYGHAWVAPRRSRLALLPVGYADGLPRVASGRAEVALGGRRRAVVGRISMDQVVVDLGDPTDDRTDLGDLATVFGPGLAGEPTVADWASWSGTLPHEIVTGLGSRLVRTPSTRNPVLRSLP